MQRAVEPAEPKPEGSLAGQPVVTTTAITLSTAAIIYLLRTYGHDVTQDQENAIINLLKSPIGEGIVAVIYLLSQRVNWANAYSRISVFNLTGRADPAVPATPPVVPTV